MLGVGGNVASPVSLHRFNFIHFVFSEADGAKATDAETEADYDEYRKRAGHDPLL